MNIDLMQDGIGAMYSVRHIGHEEDFSLQAQYEGLVIKPENEKMLEIHHTASQIKSEMATLQYNPEAIAKDIIRHYDTIANTLYDIAPNLEPLCIVSVHDMHPLPFGGDYASKIATHLEKTLGKKLLFERLERPPRNLVEAIEKAKLEKMPDDVAARISRKLSQDN
jgi:hypothetical protein